MENNNPVKNPDWLSFSPVILILALWIFFVFVILPPAKVDDPYRPLTIEEVVGMGKQDLEHEGLISLVKEDLKITKSLEIKIFLGPYDNIIGEGELISSIHPLGFLILLDQSFYQGLSPKEKIALIAHELGHLTNKLTLQYDLDTAIQFQIEADTYATKYTAPETMMSVLKKVHDRHGGNIVTQYEYRLRIENLEKIKQGEQAH